MLQIDTVSIDPHEDGTGGTITLAMQNNGLADFTQPYECVCATHLAEHHRFLMQ